MQSGFSLLHEWLLSCAILGHAAHETDINIYIKFECVSQSCSVLTIPHAVAPAAPGVSLTGGLSRGVPVCLRLSGFVYFVL